MAGKRDFRVFWIVSEKLGLPSSRSVFRCHLRTSDSIAAGFLQSG